MKNILISCLFISAFGVACSGGSKFGSQKTNLQSGKKVSTTPSEINPAGEVLASKTESADAGVSASSQRAIDTPSSYVGSESPCEKDLQKTFNGYSIKGGKSVQVVSPQAQNAKKYEVKFPESDILIYSQGQFSAKVLVNQEVKVKGIVSIPGAANCSAEFSVLVQPDSTFVSGTSLVRGLKGNLYEVPVGTNMLPDLSKLTSIGKVYASNLDIPKRNFTEGFPGVTANLIEWFAIDFTGKMIITTPGTYHFRLSSDDGSIMYLNGSEAVNNDGWHGVQIKDSQPIELAAGEFPIQVKYFQGPKTEIALQMFYKGPGVNEWTIVPQSMLNID
jgi:PA14 domain